MHILPVFLLTLLGGQQVLDDFRYGDTAAARAVWTADEGSPPVDVVKQEDRFVLRLPTPFATKAKLRRAIADRRVQLDLSAPGGFQLEAAVDDPTLVGGLTLYFRSGSGWYAADKPVGKSGWRTLRFPKNAFTVEGTPAGWGKIDGIRLSAWRPMGKSAGDTSVSFRRLAAVWHDVALVAPVPTPSRTETDLAAAKEASHRLDVMLDELGLGADLIDENAVARGDIGRRPVVVLPSNFTPNDRCVAALAKFVGSGGKLVIYAAANVPPPLRAALQLADDPNSAVQENAHGAIFDYDVPADSREAKNQIAATLGRLVPSLWAEMAQAELDRAGKIGPYETFAEALCAVKPHTTAGVRDLNRARRDWAAADRLFAQGAYDRVIETAQAAHDSMVKAYLASADSPRREGRAVWNHSGTGAFPDDPDSWDRTAKLLADNGFNMVFPNMLWGGLAHYPSDVLPRSVTFRQRGDQIYQCCAAAKKYGIEVHVWKVDFNLITASKDFVEKLRSQGRTQVSVKGEPSDWLCPSNPENQQLELDSLLEVARKYPVDGLHLDYIRYPGREYCYCDGCRQRFEAASGKKIADKDWPKVCFSGARKDEYNDWRCRQITELVTAVSREAKRIRPGIKISAAVFGSYPGCRESVAQDWPAWIKAGSLDFVCPMDYTADDTELAGLVRSQMKLIGGRVPLYVGIGATATGIHLTPDQVVGQIIAARSLGAGGFSIFNLSPQTAATIIPAVGEGAASHRAVPPHHTP
jgi:uncharacterized lipoprotein YddW (UPF0748 family)